jgi:hypothetical protein
VIEQTLVCDECSRIIAAATTAAKARREAREQCGYVRRGRKDLCAKCAIGHVPGMNWELSAESQAQIDAIDENIRRGAAMAGSIIVG